MENNKNQNSHKVNCCLNNKITFQEKLSLLKRVCDDLTLKALKDEKKINEAFDFNLANIIIATRGEF